MVFKRMIVVMTILIGVVVSTVCVAISTYNYKIASIFTQYDWRPSVLFESVLGLRFDRHNVYGKIITEISKKFKHGIRLIFGAKNLLDFQQSDVESPLMYNKEGELGNVVYIWGPLPGRKLYASVSVDLE